MKKLLAFIAFFLALILLLNFQNFSFHLSKTSTVYPMNKLEKPELTAEIKYIFYGENYSNPEYELPLKEMPENYERDIVRKLGIKFSEKQKQLFLENGVLIIPVNKYERFEDAYRELSFKDVPIFITSDSLLHLFHIEFNEILKNLEIKKLSPMLKSFLEAVLKESVAQYNTFEDKELKELARRNIAYLSVAIKLLEPSFAPPNFVKDEVEKEIKRIEEHKGFFKSEIFSKDCPRECLKLAFKPDESCSQFVKGGKVFYNGKWWKSEDFYREVCTRYCYCEDYSQYVPRGHYMQSEELKRYFKAMMWLGRMTFKLRGENWTKQAVLLTAAVKRAKANFEGKTVPAYELWRKIYAITGFFAGVSEDLGFYEYDKAISKVFGYGFNLSDVSERKIIDSLRQELKKEKSPKILSGFEIDIAGSLEELTKGLRVIGQRYALDSQILGDLVYKNIGPNPKSCYYEEVIDFCVHYRFCSKPKEFYFSCENMEKNRTKYWNEVCDAAIQYFCGFAGCSERTPVEKIRKLYSVCRFMPSGLDVMETFGNKKAKEMLEKYYNASGYCNYKEKESELKELVNSYDLSEWTKNLYNTWLWLLQPVLEEKPKGYPNWMRSELWKFKDLITALASWAELRHDTILYVKQSYTWAVGMRETALPKPLEAKYYGYVEPNPELFARAKFAVDFLKEGLENMNVSTSEVSQSLEMSSKLMEKLEEISRKELRGETLTEADYNFIKNIHSEFESILEKLASALTVKQGSCPPGARCSVKTSLEGKEDAFKTTIVADVHTDANTKRVLEVGVGKIDWLLVAHKSKEGRIGIAVGPIFSYYEFPWPMSDRLTDEKWRGEVLGSAEKPEWYESVVK